MPGLFNLDIITPERRFFGGRVEEVVIDSPGGKMGVLAGHVPMVAAVSIGEIDIKDEGGSWLKCFTAEGFMEVRPGGVVIMAQVVGGPRRSMNAGRRRNGRRPRSGCGRTSPCANIMPR
jgi:F-type H+-transporting ATPase subunit epsilon